MAVPEERQGYPDRTNYHKAVVDEVIECEAVVTGHEVYACLGLAFFMTVNLGAAEQPVGKGCHRTVVATEKAANIVAEPAIPLHPSIPNEATYLVEAGRIISRGFATVVLRDNYAPAIRVEQNLGGIKTHPARVIKRPLDPGCL